MIGYEESRFRFIGFGGNVRQCSCFSDPSFLGQREIVLVISEQFLHEFLENPSLASNQTIYFVVIYGYLKH